MAKSMNRRIIVQASQGIKQRPCLQNNESKRAGGAAQAVELLPSKYEASS
jgi:hypothetical protein